MRKEYDFSKSKKNPYAKDTKRQITIRLDQQTVEYFKELASKTGITYQNLINLYLKECAELNKEPTIRWLKSGS